MMRHHFNATLCERGWRCSECGEWQITGTAIYYVPRSALLTDTCAQIVDQRHTALEGGTTHHWKGWCGKCLDRIDVNEQKAEIARLVAMPMSRDDKLAALIAFGLLALLFCGVVFFIAWLLK
jgi:hypothetical protein